MNQDKKKVETKLILLAKEIEQARVAYFQEDSPVLTDGEYDSLVRRYKTIKEENPDVVPKKNPLLQVGVAPSSAFTKVQHSIPLLSLANAFCQEDVINFDVSIKKFLGLELSKNIEYIAEPKIDGLSLSLKYLQGKLLTAATRGDGKIGEDVTHNALTIDDIPRIIPNAPEMLEVRGEVYILKSDFEELNESQRTKNLKIFANARNAAAGSLRQLNTDVTKDRPLKFFAYSLGSTSENVATSQEDLMKVLQGFGFLINSYSQVCLGVRELLKAYESICNERENIGYEVDGIVYKVNNFIYQNRLGSRSNSPRWAIAHKFNPEESFTKLVSIEIQVGRTGTLSPVAKLEPVEVGGVLVSSVTLHNENFIKGFDNLGNPIRDGTDIRVGDLVSVYRAGDVIPKIKTVNLVEREKDSKPFIFPAKCPVCGSKVVKLENESVTRCCAGLACRAQVLERLKHFVSKQAVSIEGLGEKQINDFYDLGWVTTPVDIFRLSLAHGQNSERPLEQLENWGRKSAENLFKSIDRSRNVSLQRFINSLGIRYVGEVISQVLARYYETWEMFHKKMMGISTGGTDELEELNSIDGIGGKSVEELRIYFSSNENQKLVRDLCLEINVARVVLKSVSNYFSGLTLVFTGTMEAMSRSEAKAIAERMGAKVSSSISSKTDILVAGNSAGSKLQKAEKTGVRIVTEKEWLDLIKS